MLDLLLHSSLQLCSSCSTYCSSPLAWPGPLLLLNLLFHSSCLTCYSFCLTHYFSPLTWPTLLLLFDLLLYSSSSTSSLPLVQPCCSIPFISNWYLPPFFIFIGVECGGTIQIWVFKAKLGRWELFYSIFVFWWVLLVIHVFGKWWIIMCFLFVQELFGHCTFNYTYCISLLHIAFHLHNCIVYFLNKLHLFSFNLL